MYQYSSQMYGTEWESYMGITNLAKVVGSEQVSVFDPKNSPFNLFTTPLQVQTPQGFCASATKGLVSFQAQKEVPSWSFEFPKATTTTDSHMLNIRQASGDNLATITTTQDPPSSQFTSSLCPVAESFLSSTNGADCPSSSQKYCKIGSYSEKYSSMQPDGMPYHDHFSQEEDKLLRDDAATDERPLEISFQRNQLDSCTKPHKQAPHRLCGVACVTSSNSASRRGKRRIKWTSDLHEPFMMIVNSLGGPEKAKPKAILDMMKSDLLSISHVKSHLQKCRSTIHMHKALQGVEIGEVKFKKLPLCLSEKSEEGQGMDGVAELQVKIHMQIEESRQLQLEVRRNICQQLEMQRNLQMLIQQQSQQLKVMVDYQKKKTKLEKTLETELEATVPK